tara:strand:- start:3587 stop:4609 length:1023 start_codon:yes stop_codon:yes gene_type:complete
MKKTMHPIFSDKLINDFNIQGYAGHYFIIGRSKNNTITQKAVVLEQQKRKLNIVGETKRRTQKEDEDDPLDFEQDLEIEGSVLTVKIEPISGEAIEVYKQFFSNNKGEIVKKKWVHKEGDTSVALFTEDPMNSYEVPIPNLVNDFTLCGVPIVSRVYVYQKTDIDLSKGLIETKIKWLEKIRDVCANKVYCYSKFFPHIQFCNEITLLNYEKNGNTNKRAADDIFLQKKTLPHHEFCEYMNSLTTPEETKAKKRNTQKLETQGEPKSKFQKVLVQNISKDTKETFLLSDKIALEKEEPEPELENKRQKNHLEVEEDVIAEQEYEHLEIINDESGDEDLLD